MSPTSRRKVDVERLGYHPSKPYPYDLEIFGVADLRTPAEAMHWTYSYEFYMLICVTKGPCVQIVDFEPISCSAGTLLALRPGQAHNFGSDEDWDGWIILFRPEFLFPAISASRDLRLVFDLDRLPESPTLDRDELNRASDAFIRMRDDSLIDTLSRSGISAPGNNAGAKALAADVHALLRYQFYAFATWLAVIHGERPSQDHQHSGALQRFNRFQKLVELGRRSRNDRTSIPRPQKRSQVHRSMGDFRPARLRSIDRYGSQRTWCPGMVREQSPPRGCEFTLIYS